MAESLIILGSGAEKEDLNSGQTESDSVVDAKQDASLFQNDNNRHKESSYFKTPFRKLITAVNAI